MDRVGSITKSSRSSCLASSRLGSRNKDKLLSAKESALHTGPPKQGAMKTKALPILFPWKYSFPITFFFFFFFLSCFSVCLYQQIVNVTWYYRPLAVVVISFWQMFSPFYRSYITQKSCPSPSLLPWLVSLADRRKTKHFAWNYLCSIFLPVCQLVGESASWRWEVTFSHVVWKRQCHRHIVITRKSGNDGSDITGRRTVWFRQRRQQYGTIDHPSFFICFLSSFPNSSCLTVMFW